MNPLNLFIDSSYKVKFLFFAIDKFQKPGKMVERWYKAPEILFINDCLDASADIWSVGCIFYTLITKKVLFQGNTLLEQVNSIISKIGNLPEDDLTYIEKQILINRYDMKIAVNSDLLIDSVPIRKEKKLLNVVFVLLAGVVMIVTASLILFYIKNNKILDVNDQKENLSIEIDE